jgi:hypothetical protein
LISGVDNQNREVEFEPMAFEWDLAKETANVDKHGVDFSTVPALRPLTIPAV